MQVTVKQGTFTLADPGKLRRVLHETTRFDGSIIDGLGEDAPHDKILMAYDKIGGRILGKEGAKVQTGCFYDFKKKQPHDDPQIVYEFWISRKRVLVPGEKEFPMHVTAAKILQDNDKKARQAVTKTKKTTKSKKNK